MNERQKEVNKKLNKQNNKTIDEKWNLFKE